MSLIHILDEPTINQIAAGEVVERPSAVVKELIENAMDAGATAITAEIKEGGLSFIRITDNGSGIAKEDIAIAFLRHATSKIRSAQDLLSVTSLGFRGEALSSIAAVSQLELITKTPSALNGFRYSIEGGEEKSLEEIGCPSGTTIIVRNLFYNTPARRKFLKSAMTEAGYISELMERLMISHPGISFKFIMNNQVKLQSSGNHSSKDILYQIYGRDITRELVAVDFSSEELKVNGFIGKPVITRGNRNYENYFINGRYIKSSIITKAIEEAYKPYLMQHKYPFTSLYFEMDPSGIDVNVHPQKMEIRLKNADDIYKSTYQAIRDALSGREMIPKVLLTPQEEEKTETKGIPEPFEVIRRKQQEVNPSVGMRAVIPEPVIQKSFQINYGGDKNRIPISKVEEKSGEYKSFVNSEDKNVVNNEDKNTVSSKDKSVVNSEDKNAVNSKNKSFDYSDSQCTEHGKDRNTDNSFIEHSKYQNSEIKSAPYPAKEKPEAFDKPEIPQSIPAQQLNLFSEHAAITQAPFLSETAVQQHRIIGQIFSTYWLVEYKKELYIIDQHAAHEKVLYEKTITAAKAKAYSSQQLLPPIVLSLSIREQEVLHRYEETLQSLGYEFEHFGGNEFSVRAVPADLYGISEKELLLEFIDDLADEISGNTSNTTSILEKVASLSCKAAVKANHTLSMVEAEVLIKELLTLDNPYNCPHGRPVIISMSQYELERKFKRIV